jgi:mannitol/fructose-specific phosphotransferase system IIA component (Ntr-type)
MNIRDFLHNETVFIVDDTLTKEQAIKKLSSKVSAHYKLDEKSILTQVMERENKMTTGIGGGVAIPHARVESIEDFAFGIMVSRNGIPFESLDKKDVYVLVMILSPYYKVKEHIALLSKISYFLTEEKNYTAIVNAKTTDDVAEILKKY